MLKIFNKYYSIRNLLFFVGETGLIFFGILAGMLLLNHGQIPHDPRRIEWWWRVLLAVALLQTILYYRDLYEFKEGYSFADLFFRIVEASGLSCIGLSIIYYFFPALILEEGPFMLALFFLLVLLVSWRFLYQWLCLSGVFFEKIFILGDGELARNICFEIAGSLDSGYQVVAIFSLSRQSELARELGITHHQGFEGLKSLGKKSRVDKIIVALEERRGVFPWKELLDCKLRGIEILEGVTFLEYLSGKIIAKKAPPSWLIFSEGFRLHKWVRRSKRVIDILLSLAGLILTAPLMGVIAVLVKCSSKGPVIFSQVRVGQGGKEFKVHKFRTMREDAELQTGAVWAVEDDPRVTKVGRFLRKVRLDELPQFWNVLKGEMSFVGPRPERPVFVSQLERKLPYYGGRHAVKPGITGWAQVNYPYGASEEDALRKLEYDLFYIKNISLWFDLYIVLKTVKTVLAGEGGR